MYVLTPEDRLARGAARHGWVRSPTSYGTYVFWGAGRAYEVEFHDNGRVFEVYRLGNQVTTVDHRWYGGYRGLLAEMRINPA